MAEPGLSQMLAAAAAMLLRPPNSVILAALAASRGRDLDPAQARQDFYDVLCVPQSGRYIPPYAHVLARGRPTDGDCWHFPPPRYDGGNALAPWYEAVGFDPLRLDVDPMVRGPHRPLDHAGFVLAYLAGLVASRDIADPASVDSVVAEFVATHMGPWLDRFCDLVGSSGSPYLQAVAGAVQEAAQAARERCAAPIPQAAADSHWQEAGTTS